MAGPRTKDDDGGLVKAAQRWNIIFFHPDLGIGGAERLIVDAAVGLQEQGHKVTIFTSHCDPAHCFEEARDGTLEVRVRGNTIFPPAFLNRFHILLATLRQIHLVLAISVFSDELKKLHPDVFIVDQLSACVPLLGWMWPVKQRILFYCHFPDQLLVKRDETGLVGLLKRLYRWPFDWFETWSMSGSDRVVVNSNFTKSVAEGVFPRLRLDDVEVIYPCVNTDASNDGKGGPSTPLWGGVKVFLSINRFERKKNVGLAIRAYSGLGADERRACRLVIAGGYDQRVSENVQYHKELEALAGSLGLSHATARTIPTALAIPSSIDVLFLLSVPGAFKSTLLHNAKLLIYTPINEHFGIVPVEAMLEGVPVLASNTGGPLETIVEDETGWLRDVDQAEEWTGVMRTVLSGSISQKLALMGRLGKQRAKTEFSRTKMALRFEQVITQMLDSQKAIVDGKSILLRVEAGILAFLAFIVAQYWVTRPYNVAYKQQ